MVEVKERAVKQRAAEHASWVRLAELKLGGVGGVVKPRY
jgi:hypothetical protein